MESAVRETAVERGEVYLVTGPVFQGGEVQSIGADGVLVPTATWKAAYDPREGGTGAYICQITTAPTCDVVAVAELARITGIDPFPGLPPAPKTVVMDLPQPEASYYARQRRRSHSRPGLLDQLVHRLEGQ